MLKLLLLAYSAPSFAGEGTDHSHGSGEGGMQLVGVILIIAIAGAVFWFLSNRKK